MSSAEMCFVVAVYIGIIRWFMFSDARKKILLDLFGHPSTLLPVFFTAASFILSWATSWNPLFILGSILSALIGIGVFSTRMAFHGEELLQKQRKYEREQQRTEEAKKLDDLDVRLFSSSDDRAQLCLREIRELYESLRSEVEKGEVSLAGHQLFKTVEQLFYVCIKLLEESDYLYEQYRRLRKASKNRQRLSEEREVKLQKCLETTEHLRGSIKSFDEIRNKTSDRSIGQLQKDLDRQMEIARKVDSLGSKDDEFDEFILEEENNRNA